MTAYFNPIRVGSGATGERVSDRAAAFVAAYRGFAERGLDVTALHVGDAERRPLGFTPEEVSAIRAAAAEVRDGYPHAFGPLAHACSGDALAV